MDAITEAHGATNFERVAKEAHPLKSSSAEVGALRLSELAAALEAAALEGDEATLEHELTTLAAVCVWGSGSISSRATRMAAIRNRFII